MKLRLPSEVNGLVDDVWNRLYSDKLTPQGREAYKQDRIQAVLYMLYMETKYRGLRPEFSDVHENRLPDEQFKAVQRWTDWIVDEHPSGLLQWNFANDRGMVKGPVHTKNQCEAVLSASEPHRAMSDAAWEHYEALREKWRV